MGGAALSKSMTVSAGSAAMHGRRKAADIADLLRPVCDPATLQPLANYAPTAQVSVLAHVG